MYLYQLTAEFAKLNKNVPNINYGGCTVFAEQLYKLLAKVGKKPSIIVMTRFVDHNESTLKDRDQDRGVDILHCVIMVDGVIIDNNGTYDNTWEVEHCCDTYVCMILSLDELEWINQYIRGWNSRFNREHIPNIVNTLNLLAENLVVSN